MLSLQLGTLIGDKAFKLACYTLYYRLHRMIAVRIIERAWLSYRDHQMFRLLKHAVCAAVRL